MGSAWTPAQIAAATGAPEPNVWKSWPSLLEALDARGIGDRPVQIAAIATIGVEAGSFEPVREAHWLSEDERNAYLTRMYEGREDLGNTQPGDGIRYAGRGMIQISGRANYTTYGNLLGVDLVGNPDLALVPTIAARIFALYFTDHRIRWEPLPHPLMNCADLARAGEWRGVRVAVNGGTNGLARFMEIVTALGGASMPVRFDPNTPAIPQDDAWSCAPTSLRWALTALGRNPGPAYIEDLMLRDGVVTREHGLMDATGAGLAAWIGKSGPDYYGPDGFYGNHEPSVSFDWVALEGDHAYPLLIGGRQWNHWSGVRGYDRTRDVLLLANPSNGWQGVGQEMTRGQFAALGPFSAVRVLHPDLLAVGPPEPPPPLPPKLTAAEVKAELTRMTSLSDEQIVGRYLRGEIAALLEKIG